MFLNYLKIALRNLQKNKRFAAINIIGLAIGLSVYVFGSLLVKYENTHDHNFARHDRIYTIGTQAAPGLGVGIDFLDAAFSAVGPLMEAQVPELEYVARTINLEFLITMGEESYYETLRFADPEFTKIFDFDYIHGDESALEDASGLLISRDAAMRFFGRTDVVGEVVTMDNEFDYHIAAVIENLPQNSHFMSSVIVDNPLGVVAPFAALTRMRDVPEEGNYNNLSLGNLTYIQISPEFDKAWLQEQADRVFEATVPEDSREIIAGFVINRLDFANVAIWQSFGMPVVAVVQLLSILVLVVACVNYTNLATAQSLGRTREVGMRKTMGAGRGQLLIQFLVESMTVATAAMIVAIALLEIVIPLFNNATGKALAINYVSTLPWLIGTTLLVGILAGAYPAWLITKTNAIEALRDIARKGKKGSLMRSFMIGSQFAISAFMLATVAIVYMQNEKVKEAGGIFPRSEVYTLDRLGIDSIRDRLDTLRIELENIPQVESVAFSSQVPFEQSNSTWNFSAVQGDEAGEISIHRLSMTPEFLDVYDIPLLAGRKLGRDAANDMQNSESTTVNAIVNELALEKLGFASPEEALNQRIYENDDSNNLLDVVIVGVVPTQNILGLFNSEKPWVYWQDEGWYRIGSVRMTGDFIEGVSAVEDVWDRVIPDYPIQGRFLDDVFNDVYNVLKMMNSALAGFAFLAMALALIGLFGLAAFMAAQRTREIGVRKVMGANSVQIARLLVWQFSKPVLWALVVALPLALAAAEGYLSFFADRIGTPILILAVSGAIAVMLAWGTVASHAIRIARANPIYALRYE